jgi:molecular chaperone DnaK
MKKDAELHASEDKKKQEVIEIKNTADALVYTCEKTLKDAGDKIKPEDKKSVEDKISALKDAQKSDNIEEIKTKTKELSETIQKIGAELYKQQKPEEKPKNGEEPKAEEGKYKEK